jgi:iron-sulfur cluster insertion protein
VFTGGLHVDGRIVGSVVAEPDFRAPRDAVGEGRDRGRECARPHVVINGQLKGDIIATERVELAAQARVDGNIYYKMLEMAAGAQVQRPHRARGRDRASSCPSRSRTRPSSATSRSSRQSRKCVALERDAFRPHLAAMNATPDYRSAATPLVVTEAAAAKVRELIAEEGNPALKLRVYISGGGCSGFQYGFSFDEERAEDDLAVERDGMMLVIDPLSLQYLMGAEVDYSESLSGAQFVIRNPNAKTTCGCGSSFTV